MDRLGYFKEKIKKGGLQNENIDRKIECKEEVRQLEYHKNIRATDREMQKLFENEEYNYSVRYFEKIEENLFKTIIRTPENIEFPKSKTLSINTIKKLLETDVNINSMYIRDEFTKMKNKVYEFNQKNIRVMRIWI